MQDAPLVNTYTLPKSIPITITPPQTSKQNSLFSVSEGFWLVVGDGCESVCGARVGNGGQGMVGLI
jgi:hypothetical protein